MLSDELKSFFVAFLIDCFLAEKDQERFVHVQDMLVSYQIPSVIASILEESFR